jgi:hypothetical protein
MTQTHAAALYPLLPHPTLCVRRCVTALSHAHAHAHTHTDLLLLYCSLFWHIMACLLLQRSFHLHTRGRHGFKCGCVLRSVATLRPIVTALICMYIRACTVLVYRNKITEKYANKSNKRVYASCVHVGTCSLVLSVGSMLALQEKRAKNSISSLCAVFYVQVFCVCGMGGLPASVRASLRVPSKAAPGLFVPTRLR